jgi:hypothetical protein
METPMSRGTAADASLTCHAFFAFDVGYAIDLAAAERLLAGQPQREGMRHTRKAPPYFEYRPLPLRVDRPVGMSLTSETGGVRCHNVCECLVFDFGAISVSYKLPLPATLDDIRTFAARLSDDATLAADARTHVQSLLEAIRPAITRPHLDDAVEDYFVYQVPDAASQHGRNADEMSSLVRADTPLGDALAGILRAEPSRMSVQEITEALSAKISYSPCDVAIIDWNAAVLIDTDAEDVLSVLEFANVEALEMRHLDDRLDEALEEAFAIVAGERGARLWLPLVGRDLAEMRRIAHLQIDNAALFESVNNALKLIGDQFLARVYRLAAERFHLPERDEGVLRKLGTLESIYGKLSDQRAARRMELLEWIVIILIAVSIVLPLVGVK